MKHEFESACEKIATMLGWRKIAVDYFAPSSATADLKGMLQPNTYFWCEPKYDLFEYNYSVLPKIKTWEYLKQAMEFARRHGVDIRIRVFIKGWNITVTDEERGFEANAESENPEGMTENMIFLLAKWYDTCMPKTAEQVIEEIGKAEEMKFTALNITAGTDSDLYNRGFEVSYEDDGSVLVRKVYPF